MKALVACATFGRLPFLGRVLAGFLRQTHQDKHLVFVNDDANVELVCDYDNVTVINSSKKMILPQKRNVANSTGYYDIIFPHDDDDIFLPNRLAHHIKQYELFPEIGAYRNAAAYVVYGNKFFLKYASPTDISYLQKTWLDVGGYRHNQTSGEDSEFFNKLKNCKTVKDLNNVDYVYNWGGINYHSTGDSLEHMQNVAMNYLVNNDLVGKKFHIYPDFEEYDKFLHLDRLWKKKQEELELVHVSLGKIDISNLL